MENKTQDNQTKKVSKKTKIVITVAVLVVLAIIGMLIAFAESATKYTITFYDSKTGTNIQYTNYARDVIKVPSSLTYSGYTFKSWGGLTAGSNLTVTSSNATYNAVWEQNKTTYYLNYDANGGSGGPNNASYSTTASSHSFKVSDIAPSRSGFDFKGWSTSSMASSASYVSGDSITVSSTTTLYAVWNTKNRNGKNYSFVL